MGFLVKMLLGPPTIHPPSTTEVVVRKDTLPCAPLVSGVVRDQSPADFSDGIVQVISRGLSR